MSTRAISMTAALVALLVGCGDDSVPPFPDAGGNDASVPADARVSCPSPTMACGDECVDTRTSRAHCGACDAACAAGQACVDGACDVLCPTSQTDCGGACSDLMTDRHHCGGCETGCHPGEACVAARCELSCPVGQTACTSLCVDTESNPGHCGSCDAPCDPAEVCSEGTCAARCATGLSECGGACVDVAHHPQHCGACDAACPADTGAHGLCAAGECRLVCDVLSADCNADLGVAGGDGCETNLGTDPGSCGVCGRACVFPNGVAGCSASACVLAGCDDGWDDCDGSPANGCEAELAIDPMSCGACGTVCAVGEGCMDGACALIHGEDCAAPVELVPGTNTILWTAATRDYLTAAPSCGSGFAPNGPDVVFRYTPVATESVTVTFTKPGSNRWSAVVSSGPCGALTPELACVSEFTATTMSASFLVAGGTSAHIYLVDTTSGTAVLDNPLTVDLTASMATCTPGAGGVVGTTIARVPTGLTSVTENFVEVDESATGWVYFGGTSELRRAPKAGGAVQDIEALAPLTSAQLGYAMIIDGPNLYVIDDTTSGVSGRLWRISTDGGATWSVQDYAFFPVVPADDFRGGSVHGGRIYLVTEEDTTGVATEIWSVSAAGVTLPEIGVLEASVPNEGDCFAIVRDATHYYLSCDEGGDRIVRVPVTGGASELVTSAFDVNVTSNALFGDDLDADGLFDVLYAQSFFEEAYFVCDPGSTAPFASVLASFGTGSSNYGMGFDRANRVIWMIDDDTRELVSIR